MNLLNGFVINGKELAYASVSNFSNFIYNHFNNPWLILLIVPLAVILYLFFKRNIFNIDSDFKNRKLIFLTRVIIIFFLLIAISGPFIEKLSVVQGNPKLKIFVDNSTSMELFDNSVLTKLVSNLKQHIPVEINFISSGDKSNIADNIISGMRRYDQVLLFTDGNNNAGVDIGDAALNAVSIGGTINIVNIAPVNFDASVAVLGVDKTTASAEEDYVISIKKTDKDKSTKLIVEVDGEEVINDNIKKEQTVIKKRFTEGYHTIHAKIESDDYFLNNNEFFKTVKVVPRPKILFITKGADDLIELFSPLYDITVVDNFPENSDGLNDYTAVIVDNIDASELDKHVNLFADFITEGNGMFVIGGGEFFFFCGF